MNLYEIRLQNTLALIEQVGGPTAFAERIDRAKSQISQMAGAKPTRIIGDQMARHIEKHCSMPTYWLDTRHYPGIESDAVEEVVELFTRLSAKGRSAAIRALRKLAGE